MSKIQLQSSSLTDSSLPP